MGLTAYAMKGDRERFLAAGMDAYVPKPIRPAELFAAIAEITGAGTASVGKGDSTVREAGLSRVEGDVKFLGRLVKLFREDYPKVLADMRDAIAGNEPHPLRLSAHTLKSQVGTLGLDEAFELADKLQTIGLEGDLSAAEEVYDALHDEIELRTPELMELGAEGEVKSRLGRMTNDDTFSGDSLSDLFDEDDGKTESKPAPSAARMSCTTDSSSGDQVRSILIVDDDALSREMVRTVVEKLDYRALEASNGTAAR